MHPLALILKVRVLLSGLTRTVFPNQNCWYLSPGSPACLDWTDQLHVLFASLKTGCKLKSHFNRELFHVPLRRGDQAQCCRVGFYLWNQTNWTVSMCCSIICLWIELLTSGNGTVPCMYCISRVVMMEKVVVIDLRNFCETSKCFHKAAFIISFPVSRKSKGGITWCL